MPVNRLFGYVRNQNQTCYYCGDPATSREHAPPKMMFRAFPTSNRITVPACNKHNSKKSLDDRAIVTFVASAAYEVWTSINSKSSTLTPNVLTALNQLQPFFVEAKNEVSLKPFLSDAPTGLANSLPYIRPGIDLKAWIRQLTAALNWSLTGNYDPLVIWDDAWVWSPRFVGVTGPLKTENAGEILLDNKVLETKLNAESWNSGWSAQPIPYPNDIFSFDFSFITNPSKFDGRDVMFRIQFYNGTDTWYSIFRASSTLIAQLRSAI